MKQIRHNTISAARSCQDFKANLLANRHTVGKQGIVSLKDRVYRWGEDRISSKQIHFVFNTYSTNGY